MKRVWNDEDAVVVIAEVAAGSVAEPVFVSVFGPAQPTRVRQVQAARIDDVSGGWLVTC